MNIIEKLNKQINRGRQAENALRNETVKAAFEDVEKDILASWASCDPHDEKRLMLLKMEQTALQHVKDRIALYINKAKSAEKELAQQR